jgi:hypothetical protein
LAWTAVLSAQTEFGRISGTITDPTGAAVAGATVTIRNSDTQATRTEKTDEAGFFVVENLPIGPYSVEVAQTGFKKTEQTGLFVVADGRVTANVTLQIGENTQTVEVRAGSETLNTVSGEVAHVIDKAQVDNLALNGRAYEELLTLIPGAIVTNPDQFGVLTSLAATNQVVNGHRSNENNLTVDGVGNLDAGSNGSLINNVSPDFLQEVKIESSGFSAEYGRSAGVAFNVVTKNGTNQFSGALFEYFRNDALDARNFFSPSMTELRYNDFGWDLGGPIKRNKLFFFAGEDWKRLRQNAAPVRSSLPTTAELVGNFAGTGHTIDEPGTKTPYPNDVIPASAITPDGKAIANEYAAVMPMAATFSNQAVANNATFQVPNPLNYREDLGRIDYHINDRHSLFGRWVDDYNTVYLSYGPASTSGSYIPIDPENRDRPAKSALVSETWVISPTMVNEAHLGASWNSQHYWNVGDLWQRTTEGFTFQRVFNNVGPYVNGIPDVTITSFASQEGPDHTLISPTTEIEAVDSLSIVRGQHTIRIGAEVIRNRKDQNGRSAYDGSVTFNTTGNPNTTGYALADALTGYFNTYTEASYDPMGHYRYTEPSAFIDDNWRVSRKLSVDIGLRYEYMMAMYSTANNLADFNAALYNPAQAVSVNASGQIVGTAGNLYNGLIRAGSGIPSNEAYLVPNANSPIVLAVPSGAPRGLYNSPSTWSPRASFAYGLNGKTVIRGGFGLYYDRIQGNPTFYSLSNPPFVASASYNYGNLSNITGGAGVNAPWGSIQTISPGLKVPYSEQFNLTIQRELPLHMFADVGYVGTMGHHLLFEPDINQPTWAVLGAVASTTNENSIRPYPGFSTIQQFLSWGNSNYHSLQTKLSRRMGNVLFTAAYTFSKMLGDTSSDTENSYDFYNIKAMYGPVNSTSSAGSMDISHVFVATYVWSLPTLRSQSRLLRTPFGDWQLSGVIHLQSGPFYTITGSTSILGTRVANYIGGPGVLPNPGPNGWFNPAAFAAAAQNVWGTAGVGDVQGPGMQIYNLSVSKLFPVRERASLRFRVDFFNAFNCVNFQGPAVTVTSSGFGTISAAYPARNIQMALKLQF